jgi:acetyltransferase-like isoleucine patch superfamily enzyme
VWLGRDTAVRCQGGSLRIGHDVVFGVRGTVNCYLDVEIGDGCLFADAVYVGDFDHQVDDVSIPIRFQGIVASPVRIGDNCWLGEKATVLRGVRSGAGSIVGAGWVVTRDVPPGAVVAGNPAHVLRRRGSRD